MTETGCSDGLVRVNVITDPDCGAEQLEKANAPASKMNVSRIIWVSDERQRARNPISGGERRSRG